MKKLILLILLAAVCLPAAARADVPPGVYFFQDGKGYDQSGAQKYFCLGLVQQSCYTADGVLAFTRQVPQTAVEQMAALPQGANSQGVTVQAGNGITWTDSNGNQQTCGNCIVVTTKDLSKVSVSFVAYGSQGVTAPLSFGDYLALHPALVNTNTDQSDSYVHVFRSSRIWETDPEQNYYYKVQVFDDVTGNDVQTPYSGWDLSNYSFF